MRVRDRAGTFLRAVIERLAGALQISLYTSASIVAACVAAGAAIVTTLVVPKTGGMNTTKVTVVKWIKREGERVERGEPVVELETEKVTYELDAPTAGVLLKIAAREPAEVPVGGVLGYIGEAGDVVPVA